MSIRIEDLIAANALYRPGPMDYIPDYIEGKIKNKVVYDCPGLKPILEPTYGVIVYQEQVMRIVQDLAGYTLGRADLVRRAMSKKHQDEIDAERQIFVYGGEYTDKHGKQVVIPGCIKNHICETDEKSEKVAHTIYDKMTNFAKYAFNKSHAACYAVTAFKTAFYKNFFTAEYLMAVLNRAPNIEKIAAIMEDAHEMGIEIIPPDINLSQAKFSTSGGKIVFGIGSIKNVGDFAQTIIKERDTNGPFTSLKNYLLRVGVSNFENLANAGCFDSFGYRRNQLEPINDKESGFTNWIQDVLVLVKNIKDEIKKLTNMRIIINFVEDYDTFAQLKERCSIEGFSCPINETKIYPSRDNILKKIATKENKIQKLIAEVMDIPEIDDDTPESLSIKLKKEKEALGLYLTGNPIDEFTVDTIPIEDITDKDKTVSGIIENLNVRKDKNGNSYARFNLTDRTGSISCVIFNKNYLEAEKLITANNAVQLTGTISIDTFNSDEESTKYQMKIDSVLSLQKNKHIYRIFVKDIEEWMMKKDVISEYNCNNGNILEVLFENEGICRIYKSNVNDNISSIAKRIA